MGNILFHLTHIPVGSASGLAAVDDFNDGLDDGWLRYNPLGTGAWSFPNGGYRIQSAVTPNSQFGPARAGSFRAVESYSAFYIAVDIVAWDNTLDEIFGLIARVGTPGLGTTRGYSFTYATRTGRNANGELQILRISGEQGVDPDLAAMNFSFQANQAYRLVFTGAANEFRGEVYSVTNLSTPIAVLTGIDPNPPFADGNVGVFTYDNSPGGLRTADTTFDNFEFKELQPPLTIEKDASTTDVRVSWPAVGNRLSPWNALRN
jgi:hypothetical protein